MHVSSESNRKRARSDVLCHVVLTIEWIPSGGCSTRSPALNAGAHRARTGCAVLMQTGSGPSLGITRCQLCHLPYSRDSRLDLSRLNPRRASFRIWTLVALALLSVRFFHLFLSLSRSHSVARNFPPFAFTSRQDKVLRSFFREWRSIDEYVRR